MQHHSPFQYLRMFIKEGIAQIVTLKNQGVCALGREWPQWDWVVSVGRAGSVVGEAVGFKLAHFADPAGVEFDPQALPF